MIQKLLEDLYKENVELTKRFITEFDEYINKDPNIHQYSFPFLEEQDKLLFKRDLTKYPKEVFDKFYEDLSTRE